MKKITIEQLLKQEKMTLTTLANKVDLAISTLSKISHDNMPITKNIQAHFNKVYKDYLIVSNFIDYKKLYYQALEENNKLKKTLEKLKKVNKDIINYNINLTSQLKPLILDVDKKQVRIRKSK